MAITIFPFILPDTCKRTPVRQTSRNFAGQQVIATRKLYEVYHTIRYSYGLMSSRQYRIIDDHFRTMNGGVTSFYVIDWSDPRPISSISGDRVVVNNVQGLSVNAGDGGKNLILWQNSGDYGDNCTASVRDSGSYVMIDKTKAWDDEEWQDHEFMDSVGNRYNASDNTSNKLVITTTSTVFGGAYDIYRYASNTASIISTTTRQIIMSASPEMAYTSPVEKFVIPIYECFYAQDSLGLEPSKDDFNLEPNDNYGPFYSGSIEFIQKGTGT
jgi:hypothetical protein